ncbi:hypothetical protein ACOMHN_002649 [Nucella lapillus]
MINEHLPTGFYNAHPSEAARAMVMLADALGSDLLQHVLEVPTALIAASVSHMMMRMKRIEKETRRRP